MATKDDSDNKYRYWMVTLQLGDFTDKSQSEFDLPKEGLVESAFASICEEYVFQLEVTPTTNKLHWQCCIKLVARKRQGTLLKELQSLLYYKDLSPIQVQRMMGTWPEAIKYCTKADSRSPLSDGPYISSGTVKPYEGSDIEFLNNVEARYPWQITLFEILFETIPFTLRKPNDRDIIWITDEQGNSGKSKFVKYCCYYNKGCAKISFGSAGQLRSAIIHAGAKVCYFVDMPRTLGTDDSVNSIISALEDVLNGFVVSSYYGETKTLLMEPPQVVVFSNNDCPYDKLSSDRWQTYRMWCNKEMTKI